MNKVRNQERKSATIKPVFPFLELAVLVAFVFVDAISFFKFQQDNDIMRVWTIIAASVALIVFGLLFNSTNKTVTLTKENIRIRKWIYGGWTLNVRDIIGFDLKEEYDRHGISKNLRLWIDNGNYIVFHNSNYTDMYVFVEELKRFGIRFLGTKQIQSRYKGIIKWFMIISSGLAALGFLLVRILDLAR
jgi:hypothetical protein